MNEFNALSFFQAFCPCLDLPADWARENAAANQLRHQQEYLATSRPAPVSGGTDTLQQGQAQTQAGTEASTSGPPEPKSSGGVDDPWSRMKSGEDALPRRVNQSVVALAAAGVDESKSAKLAA